MMPGGQIAASIEILETLQDAWDDGKSLPVDALMGNYFRSRRYIGAKDKGFISRRVYGVLRKGGILLWYVEQSGMRPGPRALVLAELVTGEGHDLDKLEEYFSGERHAPAALNAKEKAFIKDAQYPTTTMPEWMRLNVPEWTLPYLKARFGEQLAEEIGALNEEAPLDLRVNTLKTTREDAQKRLMKEGFAPVDTPYSPVGLRLIKRGAIFSTKTFQEGLIEVQDEGSQLVALLANAQPGQKVIDFCAGAGGKTLALAAQMQNKGRILAWDTSESRLERSKDRLRRAGVDNVQRHAIASENDPFIKRHKASADCVLIDAPCSGSGTWRRNPDLKWRFNKQDLQEILAMQKSILESASRLVKPGGKLVYVTCSIFREENEEQISAFLAEKSDFSVVSPSEIWNNLNMQEASLSESFAVFTPYRFGTDGFFAAILQKQ